MMNDIKVALVGVGGVARRCRRIYASLEQVKVVLAMDADPAEARAASDDIGGARWTTSLPDVMASDADVVVISTPNHLHREHAIAALKAGKHVLLQKPMARTEEEARTIVDAAGASGKTLGMYMNLLDHPLFHDIRCMVESGYLGQIGLVSARLAHRGGLSWQATPQNWRVSRQQTGGGAFIQLGVHYLHLIRWILRDEVVRVQAFMKNLACPQVEGDDLAVAHLELARGPYASVETSWCVQEEHVSVLGTRGSIHYRDNCRVEAHADSGPFHGHVLHLKGDGTNEVVDPLVPPEWDDGGNSFNQHRRFADAVRHDRRPDVDAYDGLEDVRLVQACEESARRQRVIDIRRESLLGGRSR